MRWLSFVPAHVKWRYARHAVLLITLVVAALLQSSSIENKSPTADEWAHLTRGISYWTTGDTRLSYAHPPLANAFAAFSISSDPGIPDLRQLNGWEIANAGVVSDAYIEEYGYDKARAQLFRARQTIYFVLALAIVYVYIWGLQIFSWGFAVTASVLLALNPTFLGQAQYVTTDLAAGVTTLVATGELVRHLSGHGRYTTWVTLPFALSLAVLSKHSGLLLLPIFIGITLGVALLRKGWHATQSRWQAVRTWAVHTCVIGLSVLLAVHASYRFQDSFLTVDEVLTKPEPQYWVSAPYEHEMLETRTPLRYLPGDARIPLPYTWLFGVVSIGAQNHRGFPWASFFGRPTPKGHPAYFPTMLFLKMPLGMLLLGLGGLLLCLRRQRRPSLATTILVVVMLSFLGFSIRSQLNMGIRHVLPSVTLLTVLCAVGAVHIWRHLSRRGLFGCVGPVVLGAVVVVEAVFARYDFLGYYSPVVGRSIGHKINVAGDDWGQDRAEFVSRVAELGLFPLYYDSITAFRRREVEYLGLDFVDLECDTVPSPGSFVALHAMRHVAYPKCFGWLQERVPLFHVNHHILIYWIPFRNGESLDTSPMQADRSDGGRSRTYPR